MDFANSMWFLYCFQDGLDDFRSGEVVVCSMMTGELVAVTEGRGNQCSVCGTAVHFLVDVFFDAQVTMSSRLVFRSGEVCVCSVMSPG